MKTISKILVNKYHLTKIDPIIFNYLVLKVDK